MNAWLQEVATRLASTVKPPIKDALKEDKPLNKGQTKITSERGQPLYKGQNPGSQMCPFFGGSTVLALQPCIFNIAEQNYLFLQGAYIPPVLQDTPQSEPGSKDHSHSGFGYQSFGSTDRMGRKSASQTPNPAFSPTPQPQQSTSTLERRRSPGGPVVGGASGANQSAMAKDREKPKAFV